jgi:hypothetical protein
MMMDVLSKAGLFLQQHGRDIDQARFEYHFGSLSIETLLAILEHYQNPDGGFFGLECDIAALQSNPFAVEIALLICLWANAPVESLLLVKAAAYLEHTQDPDGGWRFVPEIYEQKLAPWFQGWPWPNLNPACTLAGLLLELKLGPKAVTNRVQQLFERLEKPEEVTQGDFYTVRPYAIYFIPETGNPRQDFYRSELLNWFIRQHHLNKMDNTHFFVYIRSPRTYAGESTPTEILDTRLDLLLAEQAEDGGWPSPYDAHWRPWITVNNLLVLREFGRI